MFADLHLHTAFSDGTYSPEELAGHARHQRLAAIAVTDHDTAEGCVRAAAACVQNGLEFIPGIELTAELEDHELHILGYGFEAAHPEFQRELATFQNVRQQRIREMVTRLNDRGVPLRADAVFALANCRSPGRPHVARALVQAGVCSSLDEAFERFLKKHRPAWVPKFNMSALRAIELLHAAGGLAVMAHPGLNRIDPLIPALVDAGLDGLECHYRNHTEQDTSRFLALARKYGLLVTGGSDFHGANRPSIRLGTGEGNLHVPQECWENLEKVMKR